jgi:hypothetical protein
MNELNAARSGSGPGCGTPCTKCWISPASTPRSVSSRWACSMSLTVICRPPSEPGSPGLIPVPIVIEQAEPGGVIWTTRKSPSRWSTSTLNRSLSA